MNLSGASIDFTAYHFDELMDEGWHEHTWVITVWWPLAPFRDGRPIREAARAALEACLTIDDDGHRCFPGAMWSGEAIARTLRVVANIVKINVDRPGFHVEVWC